MNYVKLNEIERFKAYENNKVLYTAINEIIERIVSTLLNTVRLYLN